MESVLLDGGRDAVRRPGLGFLGTFRFAAKPLGFGGWKSLDFLGFSRPKRDLSMGYAGKTEEEFFAAFCPFGALAAPEQKAVGKAMRERTVHRASIT
jgi:hypothetical protein